MNILINTNESRKTGRLVRWWTDEEKQKYGKMTLPSLNDDCDEFAKFIAETEDMSASEIEHIVNSIKQTFRNLDNERWAIIEFDENSTGPQPDEDIAMGLKPNQMALPESMLTLGAA